MKLLSIILLLASVSLNAEIVELSKPVKVTNDEIIATANNHMESAIYWEDEGYEYNMLEKAKEIYITTIYKDQFGKTEKLELAASVRSGGFGWHNGYLEGLSHCSIKLIKNTDGSWKDAKGFADCETDFDED